MGTPIKSLPNNLLQMPEQIAPCVVKFSLEAGLLYRRTIRGYLNRLKFKYEGDIAIAFIEDKQFLSSVFEVRMSGQSDRVVTLSNHVSKQLNDYFQEDEEYTARREK